MADIWPSTPDTSAADESDPRVIGLDDEDAEDLLSALSSGTARELLSELHDEPTTPSTLADRLGTTLQNVQYHLGNLREAEMVEVIDVIYSEKGREMKVYAPADRPLVMFASPKQERAGLKESIMRLLGAVGVLAVGSLLVQVWLEGVPELFPVSGLGSDDVADAEPTPMAMETADAAQTAEQAAGLPPGLLFFLGGALVLLSVFGMWYLQQRLNRDRE